MTQQHQHQQQEEAAKDDKLGSLQSLEDEKRIEESVGEDEEMAPLMNEENNAAVFDVVNEWAQGTSIHGVANVTDRNTYTWWKRLIWACLVVLGFSLMVWQVGTLVKQYRNYDVITDTQTIVPKSMEFPAVTICNLNRFMNSKKAALNISEPRTRDEYIFMSQNLSELVLFTMFNEDDSIEYESNWTPVVTSFGLCFTFETNETVVVPGSIGGLLIWANVRQDEYDPTQDTAGLRLAITQPGTPINDLTPFETIKPGTVSYARLDKTTFEREEKAPWARCHGDAPAFSTARCFDECANQEIREQCNCKRAHDQLGLDDMNFCTYVDWFTPNTTCNNLITLDHKDTYALCDCNLPPCKEDTFQVSVTNSEYSQAFLKDFETQYNWSQAEFKQNFLALHVNFRKIQYDLLTETKAMSFSDLLGAVGGSMGLALGISILSVIELFGDLCLFRLAPRLCGVRYLHGFGTRVNNGGS